MALTKASGFRKCERLACLESGARAALAAAKEAVAEAIGLAKKSRAFLLIEQLYICDLSVVLSLNTVLK